MAADKNSKATRVDPVFGWLDEHGGADWPGQLLSLVDGFEARLEPGPLVEAHHLVEVEVPPSARRLAWMIRNAERLAPRDGRRWDEYRERVFENPLRADALEKLDRGETDGIPAKLKLEGPTHADCLIECERLVVWIEGKRTDWLDPSTTWDLTRDQLARNAEAAWLYASELGKDSCVVICHEQQLKHHEELLIDGYRSGTLADGWPHLTQDARRHLGDRIGTLTWHEIADHWPSIKKEVDW